MNCKNCESSNVIEFVKQVAFTLLKCKSCGLVFKSQTHIDYQSLDESHYKHYNFDRTREAQEIMKVINKILGTELVNENETPP